MINAALPFFLVTATLICATPGPSTLLVLTHAASGDIKRPAMLILGAIVANSLLIAAVAFGIGSIFNLSHSGLFWLRIVGGIYLILLGWSYAFARQPELNHLRVQALPGLQLMSQAFLTSITNPKALLFYTAFLPGFVIGDESFTLQIIFLGSLYLGVFVVCLLAYAAAGCLLGAVAPSKAFMRLKDRVLGVFLIGSGVALLRWTHAR